MYACVSTSSHFSLDVFETFDSNANPIIYAIIYLLALFSAQNSPCRSGVSLNLFDLL